MSSTSTREVRHKPTRAGAREFREFGVGLSGYFKSRGVAALVTTTLLTLLGGESATGVALSTGR